MSDDLPGQRGAAADPRLKIVATLLFLVAVAVIPPGMPWLFAPAAGVLLIAAVLGRVGPWALGAPLLRLVPLVAFFAGMTWVSHHESANWALVSSIVAKTMFSVAVVVLLSATTPAARLFIAARRLGAPRLLISSIALMLRYQSVLIEERDRMQRARQSRSGKPAGIRQWPLAANMVGVMLIRSLERGERVHRAMLARGWDGDFRSLDG